MEQAEIHEVLVRARNELDRRGLAKGRLGDENGGVCLRGALVAAGAPQMAVLAGAYKPDQVLANLLEVRMFESMFPPTGPFFHVRSDRAVYLNNHPDTTKEDVLALFDRAIAATAPEPEDIQLDVQPEPDLIPA